VAKERIRGGDAVRLANEGSRRGAIALQISDDQPVAVASSASAVSAKARRDPPRVRKPSAVHEQCYAPTPDLASHEAAMRKAFGGTVSDEFARLMLGKLMQALRPGPWDTADETTVNGALALIASLEAKTELEAVIVVQIASTAFAGMKMLQLSQRHLEEPYIEVYGGYALKLLRLQLDMIKALDRHRRGTQQTMECGTCTSTRESRGSLEL